MITESQIKAALRAAPTSGKKSMELKDGGERGAGRLMLVIRPFTDRITAEWYAVSYRDNRRAMAKIDNYPTLSLADARKRFREEFAPAISAGQSPNRPRGRRTQAGTVEGLFRSYVDSLKTAGKRSWVEAERLLLHKSLGAARAIGPSRVAASVNPSDIVPFLAEMHSRGVVVLASIARSYIRAAFAFGMKAEHDYTARKHSEASWGIKGNPVDAIPADQSARRTVSRFLSPAEFHKLWDWCAAYDGWSRLVPVIQLMMLTGQRVEEILRISSTVFESDKSVLFWEKTKNGMPHLVPLCRQAVDILSGFKPNKHGWFFPHIRKPALPAIHGAVRYLVTLASKEAEIDPFTPRDIRRTWKTLAGDAGIPKDMRDMLQNHSKSDVSSRHYDRYDALPEKRAAIAKWEAYVDGVLGGEIVAIGQRKSNVIPIGRGAAA